MQTANEDNALDEVSEETVDLEAFARAGKKPPRAKAYRFKVNDGEPITVDHHIVTGREVLTLAGLTPPENYTLRVKLAGQKPEKVGLDDNVDLRRPGIEKFKALPRDQTEGYDAPLRRQYELPSVDGEFLDSYGLPWETMVDGSQWVLIHDFSTDERYNHHKVTIAIRLETGYPRTPLDMVYVYPALARVDGKSIGATTVTQTIEGKPYQRWSRHRTAANPWRPGFDNIGTHLHLIEDWFAREFSK